MSPTISVPNGPNMYPEFLNAMDMAKTPLPSEDFSRWISVPAVLLTKYIIISYEWEIY